MDSHPFPLNTRKVLMTEICPTGRNSPQKSREKGRALTNILARQASVTGHVDKQDVFASILLEGDVLLPVEGEGSIVIDGATHASIAVHLEQKTSVGGVKAGRELRYLHFQDNGRLSWKSFKTTLSTGTGLEPRSPNSLCKITIMKALHMLVSAMETCRLTGIVTSYHMSIYKHWRPRL